MGQDCELGHAGDKGSGRHPRRVRCPRNRKICGSGTGKGALAKAVD